MKAAITPAIAVAILMTLGLTGLPQDAAQDKPAQSASLCRPGFIFIELVTERVTDYLAFFESVSDFEIVRNEDGYAAMKSMLGELVFLASQVLPDGHPNKGKPTGRGYGIEVAIVVPDLDKSFAKAIQFKSKGWKISAGIGHRPWGARDFRVVSPDGYYLRFTEPM